MICVLSVKGRVKQRNISAHLWLFLVLIRERLEKKLNFDNYKEKFGSLLHVEELQMQKDIRNYDMKGVIFNQEKGDRRFLILEVSHRLGTSVVTESSFTVFLLLLEARSLH